MKNKAERDFGLLAGGLLLAVCLYKFIAMRSPEYYSGVISLLILICAIAKPQLLNKPMLYWMRLSGWLGIFNTIVILCILFVLVFIPIALVFKLMRIDPLERTLYKNNLSYWQIRDKDKRSALKHQF
jgi:hypothetical protein